MKAQVEQSEHASSRQAGLMSANADLLMLFLRLTIKRKTKQFVFCTLMSIPGLLPAVGRLPGSAVGR